MNDMSRVVAGPSLTVFPPRRDARRTVCVIGVSRGGGSAVAGIVRRLGVFMGGAADELTNEDREFQTHGGQREIFQEPQYAQAKAQFLGRAAELIRERNAAHDVWGWKDPLVAHYVGDILVQLRNPVFILVTRDIGAVAQRARLDQNTIARRALLAHIKGVAQSYERIVDMLGQRARPTLLVSYERTLRAPVATGHAIAEFLGLSEPDGFEDWLAGYVLPDRADGLSAGGLLAPRQFAASAATRALLHESLRPRQEGFVPQAAMATDLVPACNTLYETAVALLNDGDYAGAQDRALAIVNLHVPDHPYLFDGPLGTLAELHFATGPLSAPPDVVCGAYYLLGLANLLGTHAQRALICLSVAEAVMRRRLELHMPGSILSNANYWSCVFHVGVAARAAGRPDLVESMRNRIAAAASPVPPAQLVPFGTNGLAEVGRRAAAEL